jgi:hypothetical protein
MMRCIAGSGGGSSYNPASVAITGGTINSTSIGATTPAAGKFTTIIATSTITPNSVAGIVGTTAADSAQAGSVGQILTLTTSTVAGNFPTATFFNGVDIELTAGCWLVTGSYYITPTGGTTLTRAIGGLSLTASVLPAAPLFQRSGDVSTTAEIGAAVPSQIVNVSVTTHVYLIVNAVFSGSTAALVGQITASRIR